MNLQINRTLQYYYLKLKRLKGDPASLARGVALGTFIGITPTIPLHTALIIILSFPLRASKVSSLLSSFMVSNPFTFFFQYYFSWYIGNTLLPGVITWEKMSVVMGAITSFAGFTAEMAALGKLGVAAVCVLVLGGCILALPFTIVSYFLSLQFFRKIETKRAERRARQNSRDQLS
ncbi:MAG: DUF2062 domain-containing protein [Proteobacteria bacterium]|nr:DUF2062 domain-containing protein [Pseudomonadota bacterium]MBU1738738.1 DUF2062 domain-containing protein [Pseudomonadota bacterium]